MLELITCQMVHTAMWPKDYTEGQWKDDRVAVIGSGASSIQTVPGMQPKAKHIDAFIRVRCFIQGTFLSSTHVKSRQDC